LIVERESRQKPLKLKTFQLEILLHKSGHQIVVFAY
jgi:hypothetical protein